MLSLRIIASVAALFAALNPQLALASCATQETQPSNIRRTNDYLISVAGASALDAWAVGSTNLGDGISPSRLLLEHFDGTLWSVVTPPHSLYNAYFTGVSARASNDVWAVGTERAGTFGRPLNEHWDGTMWKVIDGPTMRSEDYVETSGISMNPSDANDVWAVGTILSKDYGPIYSFAEHWNGGTWSPSDVGSVPGVQLFGVSTLSDGEAWAVGSNTCTRGCFLTPIIAHWDGTQWNRSQGAFQRRGILNAVAGTSAQDVWAVGSWAPIAGKPEHVVIEHFDGQSWKIVPSPDPGEGAELTSVTAASPTDAWATGSYPAPFSSNATLAFLEHWNGKSWKVVLAPSSETFSSANGIVDASGSVIAVGDSLPDSTFQGFLFTTFGFTAHC